MLQRPLLDGDDSTQSVIALDWQYLELVIGGSDPTGPPLFRTLYVTVWRQAIFILFDMYGRTEIW